jgi:predicted CXXCH cytochrome family protein
MKQHFVFSKRTMIVLLCGALVGLMGMALFVGAAEATSGLAAAQGTGTPASGSAASVMEAGPQKDCAECHPDISTIWASSSHAHAYDDAEFTKRWNSMGKPGECLACHTTGYQSTANAYTAEGVQCEACHGEALDGHPPEVMPVKADTDYCGACHTTTLGEWRLTGHSAAGVGCMDCHDPHSQDLLFDVSDELCLDCHRDEMGDYLEDLHIQKDIGCVDCHALVISPDPIPNDGIVPTGHAFTITTDTCVACHTDTLHAGFSLPGYEGGAKAANGHGAATEAAPTEPPVDDAHVAKEELTMEQRVQALEAALASTRFSSLFQGGIIGLALGGLTVYYLGRNQARKEDETESPTEGAPVMDGEVVDQELEKLLIAIERGVDWIRSKFPSRKGGKES